MTNRPLTPEELEAIKVAPEWATNYTVYADDVLFESELHYQWRNEGVKHEQGDSIIYGKSSLIPTKPFDLDAVEWSDKDIKSVHVYIDGSLDVRFKSNINSIFETKQDIINKFKALGLTEKDLK